MSFEQFCKKVHRYWVKMRFQPIRVFCFHQVSDVFEPETMWKCDWTQTDDFKQKILTLKRRYTFISLPEVTAHLERDSFRFKKYAALTADDGWASLKNIIPWLAENHIPLTLFLNPLYLDGNHYQSRETEKLLTCNDVAFLVKRFAPSITIASHGWDHQDCLKMTMEDFRERVEKSESILRNMDGFVPYYAFTYGRHNNNQSEVLESFSLVPVYMDGTKNIADASSIHRELLDEGQLVVDHESE